MGREMASVRTATAATTAQVQYLLCSCSSNCHGCQTACGQSKTLQGYELWRQQQIWESLSLVIFPAIVIAWFDQSIGAITKLLQHTTMFAHWYLHILLYSSLLYVVASFTQYASASLCYPRFQSCSVVLAYAIPPFTSLTSCIPHTWICY
jgi:hypothetical protein